MGDKYAGAFDDGWDAYREKTFARQKELGIVPAGAELSRHDPDVPDWGSLPPEARRLYSRMMEVFAGFLSHTDHHLGRLLDYLRGEGLLDNTIVMVISDNGASAEGGPTGTTNEAQFFNNAQEPLEESLAVIDEIGGPKHFNHYPWAGPGRAIQPFRRWKRETYRGGACDPFIVSWPAGIKAKGEVRDQYAHIIDMVPTVSICSTSSRPPPSGVSRSRRSRASASRTCSTTAMPPAITTPSTSRCSATAPSTTTAGARSAPGPAHRSSRREWVSASRSRRRSSPSSTRHNWELYHVDADFAENHDVAEANRDKLIALIATWYVEAGKYDVMPVDGSGVARMTAEKPLVAAPRDRYTYRPGTQSVPFFAAPRLMNRPHSITASVEIPEDGAEGVLLCRARLRAATPST